MIDFLRANQSVFDFFLLTLGFAYSQQKSMVLLVVAI